MKNREILANPKKMSLGERSGDKESHFCGVGMEFNDDMPLLLSHNLSSIGFDFVVADSLNYILIHRKDCGREQHQYSSIPWCLPGEDEVIHPQSMTKCYMTIMSLRTVGETKILSLTPHKSVTDTTLKPPLKHHQQLEGRNNRVYIPTPQELRRY